MMKKIILFYFILVMSFNSICLAQTIEDKKENDLYMEKIKLSTKGNVFIDTIFTFRNYIENSDKKRIVCNDLSIEKNIDSLIWESKYLATNILPYLNTVNDIALISYRIDEQNNIIANFFISKRESRETVEMMRFKIVNKEIVGINISPGMFEGFITIEEFDRPKWDLFDNHNEWNHSIIED